MEWAYDWLLVDNPASLDEDDVAESGGIGLDAVIPFDRQLACKESIEGGKGPTLYRRPLLKQCGRVLNGMEGIPMIFSVSSAVAQVLEYPVLHMSVFHALTHPLQHKKSY